ncbi:MAG: divalent-cation tolerance protein CutA [Ectothiorhodospiraceae bacterium]|nr:divalent-cation tolerance protein CutA [Ectothiorhodospiraceae bacterium]
MHGLVFITTGSREEALTLARGLIRERLAACCSVIPEVTSVYRWEGKVEEATECQLIAKTSSDVYPKLEAYVAEQHSYDVPEILFTPIEKGLTPYLAWMNEELIQPERDNND